MAKKGFDFMFDAKWYTEQGAATMFHGTPDDVKLMKTEYTRMRDTAQKRIKRLEKEMPESQAYKTHAEGFKKLREMDPRDLPKAFAELNKFLRAKGSTVSGQREIKARTIKAWKAQGLNLNPQNYDRAIKILEEMRKRKLVYGSDKVVQLADAMMSLNDQQTNDLMDRLESAFANLDELTANLAAMDELNSMEFDDILSELED